MILGSFGHDCPAPGAAIESYGIGGYVFAATTCAMPGFEDGRTYHVYVQVHDSGTTRYTIQLGSTTIAYGETAIFPYATNFFPSTTGIWLTNARSSSAVTAYNAFISNISYGWLP